MIPAPAGFPWNNFFFNGVFMLNLHRKKKQKKGTEAFPSLFSVYE